MFHSILKISLFCDKENTRNALKLNQNLVFQESLSMFMMPELLPAMLSVEALEDNEVLKVEGVRLFSRICDKRQKTKVELLDEPKKVRLL